MATVSQLGPDAIGKTVKFKTIDTYYSTVIGTLEEVVLPSHHLDKPTVKVSGHNYWVLRETLIWVEGCGVHHTAYEELEELTTVIRKGLK